MITGWGWPQYLVFGYFVGTTILNLIEIKIHITPEDAKKLSSLIVQIFISAIVLHFGGFW